MPYDIVDAYEDIKTLNQKIDMLVQLLQEKKIIPIEEEPNKKTKTK